MKIKNSFLFLLFTLSFYAQNDTISIVRHTDNDYIVPKDLKVIYRGVSNILSINVPNVKSFKVRDTIGLYKKPNNLYYISPGSGTEYTLTIDIVLKNNKKITEKHLFRIKNITNLGGCINDIKVGYSSVSLDKNQLKEAIISLKSIDENLDYQLKVTHFIIRLPDGKKIEVFGNKISNETFSKIRIRNGESITIYDFHFDYLKGNSPGINFCKIPQMNLLIK